MLISIHTPTQGVTVVSTTLRDYYKISIHTPTQGVTGMVGYIQSLQLISIHTPTQGVTYDRWTIIKPVEDFNPHSHAGSDWQMQAGKDIKNISIHTPTQGVT